MITKHNKIDLQSNLGNLKEFLEIRKGYVERVAAWMVQAPMPHKKINIIRFGALVPLTAWPQDLLL